MSPDRLSWYIAGPLIGPLIAGLRAALNRPFGALGGFVDIAEAARTRARPGFRLFLLVGMVAGGGSPTPWPPALSPRPSPTARRAASSRSIR